MTKLFGTLAMSALMALAPALAGAQDAWENVPAPDTAQPQEMPPPPAEAQPAPPQEQPQAYAQPEAQPSGAVPPGQWVYTQQYGWIWMPYSDTYTQVPANGYGTPYAYVYYPAWSAWTWIAAPWVWGVGPWPWFGVYGPAHYAWYGYGWWRYPSHWHYYAPHGGAWAGYRYPTPRPAPYRPAPVGRYRVPNNAYRGAVAPHAGTNFARPYGGGAAYARPWSGGAARGFAPHAGGVAPAPHAGGARGGGARGGGHGHGR